VILDFVLLQYFSIEGVKVDAMRLMTEIGHASSQRMSIRPQFVRSTWILSRLSNCQMRLRTRIGLNFSLVSYLFPPLINSCACSPF